MSKSEEKQLAILESDSWYIGSTTGGSGFDDVADSMNGPITAIDIRHGAAIDAIRITYGGVASNWHGGSGGSETTYPIPTGHLIYGIKGSWNYKNSGSILYGLQFFHAHKDNPEQMTASPIFGEFLPEGGQNLTIYRSFAPYGLRWISGRSGSKLDAVKFHFGYPLRMTNFRLDSTQLQNAIISAEASGNIIAVGSQKLSNPDGTNPTGSISYEVSTENTSTFSWENATNFTVGLAVTVGSAELTGAAATFSASFGNTFTIGQSKSKGTSTKLANMVQFQCPAGYEGTFTAMVTKVDLSNIKTSYNIEAYDPSNPSVPIRSIQQSGFLVNGELEGTHITLQQDIKPINNESAVLESVQSTASVLEDDLS